MFFMAVEMILKIENSILGRQWFLYNPPDSLVKSVAEKNDIPEVVARVMLNRGIEAENVPSFLNPKVKEFLPNPSVFADMDKAIARVKQAILAGEKICIFGDYDVDGATSTALLKRFFNHIGAPSSYYIPDRLKEGYGPNTEAIAEIAAAGAKLLITVDCGITAFDALEAAPMDVVILDHHEAEVRLPKALAAVNPKRLDDESGYGYLCAAGVVFLFLVGLNKALRSEGFYNEKRSEPNLLMMLDLVALGTVCDVVPLVGVNRAFVSKGLQVLNMRTNPGIKALADISKLGEKLSGYHLGFVLGPRINACGRLGYPRLAAELLFTEDEARAAELADHLQNLNLERRDIEGSIFGEAEAMAERQKDDLFLFVHSADWHSGVIGIVASKLKELYNLPTFASVEEGDILHGSVRSVAGIDVGEIVIAAKEKGFLTAGGGHSMAAGFSCLRDKEEEFKEFIRESILRQTKGEKMKANLHIDAIIDVAGANLDLAEKLRVLEPFGAGNDEPHFAFNRVLVVKPRIVGNSHVQCFITSGASKRGIRAILFKGAENALGRAMLENKGDFFMLTGKLHVNTYQGVSSPSLVIEDGVVV